MKIERTYIVRVVQVYEGPSNEIVLDELYGCIDSYGDADENIFGSGNWALISDEIELLDDDQLDLVIIDNADNG